MKLFGNDINTVFALNGVDENSATYAFSWALSKSPTLLRETIYDLVECDVEAEQVIIEVQKHGKDKGFTDIEILIRNVCHIIFEAKRYWELPSTEQLEKYAGRLETSNESKSLIVSLSAALQEYAKPRLPPISNISLVHRSWADLHALVLRAYDKAKSREEKFWLREFKSHLMRYVSMRNPQDNRVYVVSLSPDRIKENNDYTWIDVVRKDECYFHPISSDWPNEPPIYIAFRYDGRLQSVHHVVNYEVVADLSSVNENWEKTDSDYFVYTLGPAMESQVTVRTGSIYRNGRCWCIIDTLLSGAYETISDARDETKRRLEAISH